MALETGSKLDEVIIEGTPDMKVWSMSGEKETENCREASRNLSSVGER